MPCKNQGGGPWGQGPKGPWGGGPQSAGPRPPDLEDLLRRGQDKLQQLLPGGHFSGMGIALVLVGALLLRDRATNTPLFEAHAQSEGGTSGDAAVLAAMFEAALQDFPALGATNPRRVSVTLGS